MTPMAVGAVTKLFAKNLQDCSGSISGVWGENVNVTYKGTTSTIGLESNTADKITTLGVSLISDHALKDIYTISQASNGGAVVYVKPDISMLAAGGFRNPSKKALAAAHLWLAGDSSCP